jgi:hypothetical protein
MLYLGDISDGDQQMFEIRLTIVPALSDAERYARAMIADREIGNYRIGMTPEETAKAAMQVNPGFIAIRRRIFVMFMARDRVSETLANEEFDRLQSVGGDVAKYMRLQRTGSRFALSRRQKESFALIFDNAGNHASFEFTRT